MFKLFWNMHMDFEMYGYAKMLEWLVACNFFFSFVMYSKTTYVYGGGTDIQSFCFITNMFACFLILYCFMYDQLHEYLAIKMYNRVYHIKHILVGKLYTYKTHKFLNVCKCCCNGQLFIIIFRIYVGLMCIVKAVLQYIKGIQNSKYSSMQRYPHMKNIKCELFSILRKMCCFMIKCTLFE